MARFASTFGVGRADESVPAVNTGRIRRGNMKKWDRLPKSTLVKCEAILAAELAATATRRRAHRASSRTSWSGSRRRSRCRPPRATKVPSDPAPIGSAHSRPSLLSSAPKARGVTQPGWHFADEWQNGGSTHHCRVAGTRPGGLGPEEASTRARPHEKRRNVLGGSRRITMLPMYATRLRKSIRRSPEAARPSRCSIST